MSEPDISLSWMERWTAKVLANGPIPNHVALILDGSRRWAKVNKVPLNCAHNQGYSVFLQIALYLHALGVHEVSAYIFSLENFNRTKEEVDTLMSLFEEQLDKCLKDTHGIRFRFMGQKKRLPLKIQNLISQLEEMSKDNPKGNTLNLAIAYTCQDDITQAMGTVLKEDSDPNDITVDLLQKNMYFGNSSKVDILIRTSGVTRFSDFMVWEVSNYWMG